ncbi:hypothetical protein HMPREF3229_00604 [Peptoniphilus harei]|uniref:Uncharacterized protein n=1 Tax=Peptoniphilus harei TaxID=54005 RepID=A0A133PQU0_9FIRM|nr:hypothetical protein HMPREF3229_00604 [Peptoniphilus harei]
MIVLEESSCVSWERIKVVTRNSFRPLWMEAFFIVFLPQVQIKKEENRNAVNNT